MTSYVREGDLFGQRPRCFECKEHMAVARTLFALLADESDRATTEILQRWTTGRPARQLGQDRRAVRSPRSHCVGARR